MDKVEFKRACHEAIISSESKVDLDKNIDIVIDNYIDNNLECNQIDALKKDKTNLESQIRGLILLFANKYKVNNIEIKGETSAISKSGRIMSFELDIDITI
jgi:hypothetical protein